MAKERSQRPERLTQDTQPLHVRTRFAPSFMLEFKFWRQVSPIRIGAQRLRHTKCSEVSEAFGSLISGCARWMPTVVLPTTGRLDLHTFPLTFRQPEVQVAFHYLKGKIQVSKQ